MEGRQCSSSVRSGCGLPISAATLYPGEPMKRMQSGGDTVARTLTRGRSPRALALAVGRGRRPLGKALPSPRLAVGALARGQGPRAMALAVSRGRRPRGKALLFPQGQDTGLWSLSLVPALLNACGRWDIKPWALTTGAWRSSALSLSTCGTTLHGCSMPWRLSLGRSGGRRFSPLPLSLLSPKARGA